MLVNLETKKSSYSILILNGQLTIDSVMHLDTIVRSIRKVGKQNYMSFLDLPKVFVCVDHAKNMTITVYEECYTQVDQIIIIKQYIIKIVKEVNSMNFYTCGQRRKYWVTGSPKVSYLVLYYFLSTSTTLVHRYCRKDKLVQTKISRLSFSKHHRSQKKNMTFVEPQSLIIGYRYIQGFNSSV